MSASYVQFRQNISQIELHGTNAKLQQLCDFFVRKASANQFQDFVFARGCAISDLTIAAHHGPYLDQKLLENIWRYPQLLCGY
jgi:hypothetical protein